jgi:hypothetical protein
MFSQLATPHWPLAELSADVTHHDVTFSLSSHTFFLAFASWHTFALSLRRDMTMRWDVMVAMVVLIVGAMTNVRAVEYETRQEVDAKLSMGQVQ